MFVVLGLFIRFIGLSYVFLSRDLRKEISHLRSSPCGFWGVMEQVFDMTCTFIFSVLSVHHYHKPNDKAKVEVWHGLRVRKEEVKAQIYAFSSRTFMISCKSFRLRYIPLHFFA